jgi:hypothetical protein
VGKVQTGAHLTKLAVKLPSCVLGEHPTYVEQQERRVSPILYPKERGEEEVSEQ